MGKTSGQHGRVLAGCYEKTGGSLSAELIIDVRDLPVNLAHAVRRLLRRLITVYDLWWVTNGQS